MSATKTRHCAGFFVFEASRYRVGGHGKKDQQGYTKTPDGFCDLVMGILPLNPPNALRLLHTQKQVLSMSN